MEDSIGNVLYRTFSTIEGQTTLAYILSLLGYFETDPARIEPRCMATANRILAEAGLGLREGDAGALMRALIESKETFTPAKER